jgi:hypothetical protein
MGMFNRGTFNGLVLLAWVSTLMLWPVLLAAQPTWKRVYGGFDVDYAYDAVLTDDGGVVVVGSTGSFGNGNSDVYLFKVDEFGVRQWSTTLGSAALEVGNAIILMNDGGFTIVGSTNATPSGDYDGLVMRVSPDGQLLWQRNLGGGAWDFLYSVDRTDDDGVFVAGVSYSSFSAGEAWVVRLNSSGEELWTLGYGGEGFSQANSVCSTIDGGGVITGALAATNSDTNALVLKFDSNSNVQWANSYGGDQLDIGRHIINTLDGGYSVLGISRSFGTVTEQYHFKLGPDGSLEWERNWGQIADQEGYEHLQLPNADYASIGFVTQGGAGGKDMFLLKSDPNGQFLFGQTQGGVDDEIGYAILRTDGGYLMCGITASYGAGMWDVFLVRTNEVGFTDSDDVIASFDPLSTPELTRSYPALSLYPNPCNGRFQLGYEGIWKDLRVVDASGRSVDGVQWSAGSREVQADLPEGSYVLELHTLDGQLLRARLHIVKP